MEFYSGTTEYDYDIDAVTGAILSSDPGAGEFQIWNNGTAAPPGTAATLPAATISPQSGPSRSPWRRRPAAPRW
ncbi:MAG: hypothetical protein ACLTG0_08825 [Oscillibacter sp.]